MGEVDDAELRDAFQRMRRPDWGDITFEQLKEASVRWARVRCEAVRHRISPRPAAPAPRPFIGIDRKRAAAGDRDDD